MRRQDWICFAIMALCGPAAAQKASIGSSPEMELRGGRQVDGAKQDNAYTLGVRYSFEL